MLVASLVTFLKYRIGSIGMHFDIVDAFSCLKWDVTVDSVELSVKGVVIPFINMKQAIASNCQFNECPVD